MTVNMSVHLMFGLLDLRPPYVTSRFERFRQEVGASFGVATKQLGAGNVHVGFTGPCPLVGSAINNESYIVVFGAIHDPLPGWHKGSPLDDSDKTAAFLLQRYRHHGLKFLDGTVGAYVVALWDAEEGRFILANDPRGMRTAYYTETANGLAFSTTMYALNACRNNELEIDRSLEDFLLGYEFLPWRQTLYKGVFSLSAGMVIECKDGTIREHTSREPDCSRWTIQNLSGSDLSDERAGEFLYDLFFRSLENVLPSTRRVAVLLGGFDSALVAAACRKLGKDVDTYTFRFPKSKYNQDFADDVARQFGLTHHWIDINPGVLEDGLSMYPMLFNQPSGMPHYLVQTAYVLRRIQEDGHSHCLTGDGCDELFLGYPTVYRRARFFLRYGSALKWIDMMGRWALNSRQIEMWLGHFARFTRNFLTIALRPMPRRGHISSRIFDEVSLKHFRTDSPPQAMDPETILASLSLTLQTLSQLRLAYHGKSMPGLNKTKLAGASSASGLTVLSPFQHPYLTAFGHSLPDEMLRPHSLTQSDEMGKHLLMKTVEEKGLLPPEVIYQPKRSPVSGMADQWYMGPLKDFMLAGMKNLPFAYDESFVVHLLSEKKAETLFRERVSLGDYVLNAPALLATYASYNNPARKGGGKW